MRAMFLSLITGTAFVLASAIYYVEVAEATRPFLAAEKAEFSSAFQLANTPFVDLIEGLEAQDAGGLAVKPPPREYLKKKAEQKGYDYELLQRIAFCESRWRMTKNKNSTAFGFFQIVDGTERITPQYKAGLRKTDPYVNIDMALYLYGKYRTLPWLASRSCWSE
jgi:hypothetical protein